LYLQVEARISSFDLLKAEKNTAKRFCKVSKKNAFVFQAAFFNYLHGVVTFPLLPFNQLRVLRTFIFKAPAQAISSFREFIIYLSKRSEHLRRVRFYEFLYIFLLQHSNSFMECFFSKM
jgi:hypothetical protein